MGDHLGEGRLTGAGRAVKDERSEAVGQQHPAQEFAGAKKMILADEFVDGTRPHAGGKRLGLAAIRVANVGKDIDGRGSTGEADLTYRDCTSANGATATRTVRARLSSE